MRSKNGDLHILIPVPSHNIPKTPPPAALNGSPKELWEGETIPHPVPPGINSLYFSLPGEEVEGTYLNRGHRLGSDHQMDFKGR